MGPGCIVNGVSVAANPTTVVAGATATLSVVAGGTGPFSYQWVKDGIPILNETFGARPAGDGVGAVLGLVLSLAVVRFLRGMLAWVGFPQAAVEFQKAEALDPTDVHAFPIIHRCNSHCSLPHQFPTPNSQIAAWTLGVNWELRSCGVAALGIFLPACIRLNTASAHLRPALLW